MSGIDVYSTFCSHFDGADAATAATDAARGRTITFNGNAQLDTAQSKFGGASCLFDAGTNSYLNLDGDSSIGLGSGDFVVDMWIRFASLADTRIILDWGSTTGTDYPIFYLFGGVVNWGAGGGQCDGGAGLVTDTWYHYAFVRSGSTQRMFRDGVQDGDDYTNGNTMLIDANRPVIGTYGQGVGNFLFSGWIDELRISVGTDRGWFDGFTPPVAAYSPSFVPGRSRTAGGMTSMAGGMQ